MILKVFSYTCVQSVGPCNLALSRLAVTSRHESSCHARGGKERLTWLVSWLTQTTNRMAPVNGPWNSVTISRYRHGNSHDIAIQKIPTIRALVATNTWCLRWMWYWLTRVVLE